MKTKHTLFSWLITCIGGSLLLAIALLLVNDTGSGDKNNEAFFIALLGLGFSIIVSIPSFIIYHVLGRYLYAAVREKNLVKVLLSVYAVVATLGSFFLLLEGLLGNSDFRNLKELLYMVAPYALLFVVCIWTVNRGDTGETALKDAGTADGAFPAQLFVAIAVITILVTGWDLFQTIRYIRLYHGVHMFIGPALMLLEITGLVLLGMRKQAGWYLLSVLTISAIISPLLFIGKAIAKEPQLLRAFLNPSWIFFILLAIMKLVLLLQPAMRRYFRVGAERLGAVIIAGVLLAAAFFFAGL